MKELDDCRLHPQLQQLMEFGRSRILAVALAAATGGPNQASMPADKGDQPTAGETPPAAHAAAGTRSGDRNARGTRVITHADLPLEGLPVRSLDEVVRFDINPAWVISRWGRVFTSPAEDEMRGYRVALVTGTADFDLVGSLTYYFNREQKLQRITFVGQTGNTLPLVALVQRKHGLTKHRY